MKRITQLLMVTLAVIIAGCTSKPKTERAAQPKAGDVQAAKVSDGPAIPPPKQKNGVKLFCTAEPSLISVLWSKEKEKGSPLTKKEVLVEYYCSTVVWLSETEIAALEKARGYRDINPEHIWDEWQLARVDLMKQKRANQALQHNDPSCHVPCLRTYRASRCRG